jgi:hypothetical protein
VEEQKCVELYRRKFVQFAVPQEPAAIMAAFVAADAKVRTTAGNEFDHIKW